MEKSNQLIMPSSKERNSLKIYNLFNFIQRFQRNISQKVYYFILTYSIDLFIEYSNSKKLLPEDVKKIDLISKKFLNILSQSGWDNRLMSKQDYNSFLERYYESVDFRYASLNMIYLCQDLLEILLKFGKYDQLALQRVEYFNKKIDTLINLELEKQAEEELGFNNGEEEQTGNINLLLDLDNEDENENENDENSNANDTKIQLQKQENAKEQKNIEPNVNEKVDDTKKKKNNFPKLVDLNICLNEQLSNSNSKEFNDYKAKIKDHLSLCKSELQYHKLEEAKDQIEAVIYYLRNIQKLTN